MVKYIQFKAKGATDTVYKISEKEYDQLKSKGEKMKVVKSVTRKRSNSGFGDIGGFEMPSFDFKF